MYTLELDLLLYFLPPMDEHGGGICLTRTLELPFPPVNGLALTGGAFEVSSVGFTLEEVTWDIDRQLFLAKTSAINSGHPIPLIPQEIRNWLDRGWRYGSLGAKYEGHSEDEQLEVAEPDNDAPDEWDLADKWPSLSPRSRPREVTKVLRALVREMAQLFNNCDTAYAIDQTKMFFNDHELKEKSPAKERFESALREFRHMPQDQQLDWRDKVIRKYPRLDRIAAAV